MMDFDSNSLKGIDIIMQQERNMKITEKWLTENHACNDGMNWWLSKQEPDGIKVLNHLIEEDKLQWAHWLVFRIMNLDQKIQYSIFAAEQVLDIFEKKYPEDKRPRLAIEAAKNVLEHDTKENRSAVYAAANAVDYAAADAAYAAAYAADYAAAYADNAVDYAAADAAYNAVDYAAADARSEMRVRIINHGLKLLITETRQANQQGE